MIRIAFSGKMRSGKDTAADYLMSKTGGHAARFSAPLYELQTLVQSFLGFPLVKERELLQFLGSNYARAKDENVWVNLFRDRYVNSKVPLYCTDCRFPNEAEVLKSLGFVIVRLERDDSHRIHAGASSMEHESETALDNYSGFDRVFKNNSNIQELHNFLDSLLESFPSAAKEG